MAYGIRLEVWGDYASFNRPEMKVERVTYDAITPSAARGILEAIYWKPEMQWIVDRIHVLAPLRFTHVRRNELGSKIPIQGADGVAKAAASGKGALGICVEDHRQQRAAVILRDVRYGIEAHVEIRPAHEDGGPPLPHPEAKHLEMFKRRARRGQFFHHPYLGCREFPAFFRLLEGDEEFPSCPDGLQDFRDLGLMLLDVEYSEDPKGSVVEANRGRRLRATPRFFHARMNDGVIEVPSPSAAWGAA